jgi:hypothetical protein
MALVSISEAAKLAGISRTHFYRKYINKGLLSILKNDLGKPSVEISELLRVFGTLQYGDIKTTNSDNDVACIGNHLNDVLLEKIKGLEALLSAKDLELEGYRDRERYLYRLIEHKSKKKRWWCFGF